MYMVIRFSSYPTGSYICVYLFFSGLNFGRINAMGRFETDIEPEPDRKEGLCSVFFNFCHFSVGVLL
jgi:hypothetical protein